jgi:hypothetical protein
MNWLKRTHVLQEGKAATYGPAETSSLRGIYLPGELDQPSI